MNAASTQECSPNYHTINVVPSLPSYLLCFFQLSCSPQHINYTPIMLNVWFEYAIGSHSSEELQPLFDQSTVTKCIQNGQESDSVWYKAQPLHRIESFCSFFCHAMHSKPRYN
uniref:Uncharacterized protein n=1 Tax=Opuntia streptacantha TaxID=393608 RepID=A0A7C9AYQ3_OPUST